MPRATVRDLLLAGLTFSSGAVDAVVFLALGKVFTAFQTGNLVFLGIGLVDAGGPNLVRVGGSLAAFAAGVLLATRLVQAAKGSGLWPPRVSVTLGLVCVVQALFALVWIASSGRPGTSLGHALVALSALAMGLQSGAVMSLAVTGVFTTAATATVMFLMRAEAEHQGSPSEERSRFAGVLLALVAGAAAGGLLLVHARTYAPLLPMTATALVILTALAVLRPPREIRWHTSP
jgi:uncharacterized membrane protein YoaK (UPF0700 family)